MSYIKFDKDKLINLEYSVNRELIRTNRAGSYSSTTIVGCNTRKYHGLLVCPMEDLDGENHVLLSTLDVSVIQHGATFNLGIHKYPGIYEPKGHKYIRNFESDPIPRITYRVGGVVLQRESVLVEEEEKILIRFTLTEANSPTILKFTPFLAFRNVHKLTRENMFANNKYIKVSNGIKTKMYDGYKYLHLQFSKNPEYVHVPVWYYNIEYIEEQKRGYEYQEDLFVPGYFEVPLKKGERIIFSAGLSESNPTQLKKAFESALKKRIPRNSFEHCLKNSAQQFIFRKTKKTEIIAGFPWFGRWSRDTFISLPGLTLTNGDVKTCKAVIDTMSAELKDCQFPNVGYSDVGFLNSVDAPLWYFWTIQQYAEHTNTKGSIWKEYGKKFKQILEGYRNGMQNNIKMHDNGLIYAGENGKALTWMDAIVHGKPVTPRIGYNVEINALWYNAVRFSLDVAEIVGDKDFISTWKGLPETIEQTFVATFWDSKKGYLADTVTEVGKDWSIRPNQVFATSLPYTPISEDIRDCVLETVKRVLLTPKGLRTLSPGNIAYKGRYEGNQESRDSAYHQGSVLPWLLGHFVEGYLKVHPNSGLAMAEKIFNGFEDDMTVHGIGSISEVYDGDPPHRPGGAISQAWSVAELLRINAMILKRKGMEVKD